MNPIKEKEEKTKEKKTKQHKRPGVWVFQNVDVRKDHEKPQKHSGM